MAGDPGFQEPDKFGLHEPVPIGNLEADHPGHGQGSLESLGELCAMAALHDEDGVGPAEKFMRDLNVGVMADSCRSGLDAWPFRKDLLRRGAAKPILAADEKYLVGHFVQI